MHLIYLDESGNSGTNLLDPQQPIFVLGALPIPEEKWRAIVAEAGELKKSLSEKIGRSFEIHAHERKLGLQPRPIDDEAIARIEKLSEGQSSGHPHALAWLEKQPPPNRRSGQGPQWGPGR